MVLGFSMIFKTSLCRFAPIVQLILIRFIAARVRKTFHELHLLTPSLLFLPANQVSVGYGDKIGGLNMKKMVTKNICTYL